MRVFLEDCQRLFAVYFKYVAPGDPNEQPITLCIIEELLPGNTPLVVSQPHILTKGMAMCHRTDPFYRALGRKLAFKRAMDPEDNPFFTRRVRRVFWNAFLHQIRIPLHGKTGFLWPNGLDPNV